MTAIEITVIHALGTFRGYVQLQDGSTDLGEEARTFMTALQGKINMLNDLTIVQPDGVEVTFPKRIVSTSIFKMRLVELDV